MPSLFFWKDWPVSYRRIWFVLGILFIFSAIFLWFSWFQGNNGIIEWERIQEQKTIETTVHSFRLGPFELTVPAESYVIFEYLQGSEVHHNTLASYVFMFMILCCAMVLLTVITTLDRFWFLSGMSVFILFIVSLRLDALQLFGQPGLVVPGAVLLLYLIAAIFFKSFRNDIGFATRLITFLFMTAGLIVLVYFSAAIPFPLLYLSMAAYTPGFILSILFILMVAHEIPASFVYIASQGNSKSLRHFMIISAIYLANVLITCMHEMGVIEWNFVYINLYLLLTISAILGLWGFKQRENLYDNIFSFSRSGALFYVSLAIICFATIGQLLGNANDAPLKVVRDLIIFTHTGFGIIFLAYIFSNFMVMMADNLPVHKILYKPSRMPYFTFRLAGVIVTLAFIFTSNWRSYVYHSMAGFYNYAADLYQMQGNETFSRALYERSRVNAVLNHRANYALGMIKASRLDFDAADENFSSANRINPSDFSLVNQGNLHLWRKEYFPAIEVFRDGIKIRPSSALSNNLGFAFGKVHNLDSAIYFISASRNDKLTRSSAEMNFFALTASELIPVKTDSILRSFDQAAPGVVSNAVAMATLFGQKLEIEIAPLRDTGLDLYTATLLNNYIVRNARSLDTTFTTQAYAIANDSINYSYSEALKASLAYAYYHQGNLSRAQQILAELAFLSRGYQGKYNYIMGLWALEQGNPQVAATYFNYAVQADYKQAQLYHAIALTEAQRISEALIAWDSVANSEERANQRLATQLLRILTMDAANAPDLDDPDKYQFCRYRIGVNDTSLFKTVVQSFEDPNYKAQAILDMSQRQFRADRIATAIRFYSQVSGLQLTDENLYDRVRHFELLMLASRNEVQALARQINKDITFDATRALEKMLYTALVSEASNDAATSEKLYRILGSWNPFFEDGILAATRFFRNQNPDSDAAYNILAEAIQLNTNSIRLLKAYAAEASRRGFDEYASNAVQRVIEIEGGL